MPVVWAGTLHHNGRDCPVQSDVPLLVTAFLTRANTWDTLFLPFNLDLLSLASHRAWTLSALPPEHPPPWILYSAAVIVVGCCRRPTHSPGTGLPGVTHRKIRHRATVCHRAVQHRAPHELRRTQKIKLDLKIPRASDDVHESTLCDGNAWLCPGLAHHGRPRVICNVAVLNIKYLFCELFC